MFATMVSAVLPELSAAEHMEYTRAMLRLEVATPSHPHTLTPQLSPPRTLIPGLHRAFNSERCV